MEIIEEYYVERVNGKRDKRIRYRCEGCGQVKETYATNIRGKDALICKTCANQKSGELKRGKASPVKGKARTHLSRENAANWNGGRYINSAGYVMVLVKSGAINRGSGWSNYRPEHIVVMEQSIGRKIEGGECVHHIDGDRQNNKLENLALISSNTHHRLTHQSLQKIGYMLYKNKQVRYNRETNQYEFF